MALHTAFAYKYMSEDVSSQYLDEDKVQKPTVEAGNIPYHVAVVYGGYYCSGALIHTRIVVTTASCFVRRSGQEVYVKVGTNSLTGPGSIVSSANYNGYTTKLSDYFSQVIPVEEVKIHEYYQYSSAAHNDIALVLLKIDVLFSMNVKKITLVDPEMALQIGTAIEVHGFGHKNRAPNFANKLISSGMIVVEKDECKIYGKFTTSSSFCAKYKLEQRMSDNGGPAVYGQLLVGILSFGSRKKKPYVAVFTNVSYFNRWITLNSKRFSERHCKQEYSMGVSGLNYEYNIEQ